MGVIRRIVDVAAVYWQSAGLPRLTTFRDPFLLFACNRDDLPRVSSQILQDLPPSPKGPPLKA
ncbi:hypothetical protein E2C01_085888 [Portunus trituberculatus]|uniref:Uncharacterized protein n=1 Tax=Portunus trituberculatus TaxID=210409 RepID=A0A5B7JEV6_PORTR|nr:hypothetical protein [Portunus trituberculatus]